MGETVRYPRGPHRPPAPNYRQARDVGDKPEPPR
jgi:hypothetical protein